MTNPAKETGDSLKKLDGNQITTEVVSKDRMGTPVNLVSNKETYESLKLCYINTKNVEVGHSGSISQISVIGGREPYTFKLIDNDGVGTPNPPSGLEDLASGQFLVTPTGELFGFNLNEEKLYTLQVRVVDSNGFIVVSKIEVLPTNLPLLTDLTLSNNILNEDTETVVLGNLTGVGGAGGYEYYPIDVDGRVITNKNTGEISVSAPKIGRSLFQRFKVIDSNGLEYVKHFDIFTFKINYSTTPNADRTLLVNATGTPYSNSNPLPVVGSLGQITSVNSPTIVNIPAPLADTEYDFTLPDEVRRYRVRVRDGQAKTKLAFVSGESGTVYWTIDRGSVYEDKDIDASSGITLYFQTSHDDTIIELLYWT